MKTPLVDIHTHHPSGQTIEPQGVGIHPWDVDTLSGPELEKALLSVESANACVIGEIGLDFSTAASDRPRQEMVFAAQLRIASQRGLPVVLHCVRAFERVVNVLSGYKLRAVVFHGFIGSPQQASQAVSRGYFLSFGVRSFSSSRSVAALRSTPLDHIFLETDDDPAPISSVYSLASKTLDIPLDSLSRQLYSNYLRIFTPEPKLPTE